MTKTFYYGVYTVEIDENTIEAGEDGFFTLKEAEEYIAEMRKYYTELGWNDFRAHYEIRKIQWGRG